MTSPTLTQAGALARSLLAIRDRSERMEAVAGVCAVLAEALEGTDAYTPLTDAAANARCESAQWREAWAIADAPPLLGRRVDWMYRPEEA